MAIPTNGFIGEVVSTLIEEAAYLEAMKTAEDVLWLRRQELTSAFARVGQFITDLKEPFTGSGGYDAPRSYFPYGTPWSGDAVLSDSSGDASVSARILLRQPYSLAKRFDAGILQIGIKFVDEPAASRRMTPAAKLTYTPGGLLVPHTATGSGYFLPGFPSWNALQSTFSEMADDLESR